MKKLILICSIVASGSCFAKASSQAVIASDYSWHGMSWAVAGTPFVSGLIDYATDSGFGGGMWMSNIDPYFGGSSMMPYLYYYKTFGKVGLNFQLRNFSFLTASHFNSPSGTVIADVGNFKASVEYFPKYFGTKSDLTYLWVGYTFQIDENLFFAPTVGYSKFSKEVETNVFATSSSGSYVDWKVGLQYKKEGFTTEVALTDTNRETLDAAGTKTKVKIDEKTVISLTKDF